jgi:hypothetical protein
MRSRCSATSGASQSIQFGPRGWGALLIENLCVGLAFGTNATSKRRTIQTFSAPSKISSIKRLLGMLKSWKTGWAISYSNHSSGIGSRFVKHPTAVLAAGTIMLPRGLDPWRHAAARLPLGRNEKLFLEITDDSPFVPETRVLGNPHKRCTGVYYIRPFGWPVIECFLGDQGARMVEELGPAAGFAHATDQLAALFGSAVSRSLHPLVASSWSRKRGRFHLVS